MNNLSIRKMNELSKKKKKGFTLVELIIVIAIIAILAAIAIPKFGEITRNANIKADIASAKNIHGIVAQLVAEGTDISSAEKLKTAVIGKLDGVSAMPSTKLDSTKEFTATYDKDTGNIKITDGASGTEIYPNSGKYGVKSTS